MSPGFRIRHFLYFGNSVGDESMESGPLTLDVGQDCGGIWPVSNLAGHHIQFFLDGLTHSHCHYSGLKFQSWSRERSDRSEPCPSENEGAMIGMTLCFKSPVGGSTKGNLWGVSKDVDLCADILGTWSVAKVTSGNWQSHKEREFFLPGLPGN